MTYPSKKDRLLKDLGWQPRPGDTAWVSLWSFHESAWCWCPVTIRGLSVEHTDHHNYWEIDGPPESGAEDTVYREDNLYPRTEA